MNETTQSRWIACILCAMLFLYLSQPLWSSDAKPSSTIMPDERIQAVIRRVIYTKDKYDADTREAMTKVNEMARKNPEVLAPQLIYCSVHASNEKEAVAMIAMMGYAAREWDSEMRTALIPLLEYKDKNIQKEVSLWLANIDRRLPILQESRLGSYRETLLQQKESPPPGLVSYVFGGGPSHALLLFGDIYSEKPEFGVFPRSLMWSDHVITTVKWRLLNRFLQEGDLEKARKELDTLSRHEGWYARRYVVEVLRDISKLGTPDMINRLKKDANPLVAEPAKLIK